MNTRLVSDFPLIDLSCRTSKRKLGSRKQDLLDRLSNYDYITPLRRASMKRHGRMADWLQESTEFSNWMADPKSNIFVLSGKRESFSKSSA